MNSRSTGSGTRESVAPASDGIDVRQARRLGLVAHDCQQTGVHVDRIDLSAGADGLRQRHGEHTRAGAEVGHAHPWTQIQRLDHAIHLQRREAIRVLENLLVLLRIALLGRDNGSQQKRDGA